MSSIAYETWFSSLNDTQKTLFMGGMTSCSTLIQRQTWRLRSGYKWIGKQAVTNYHTWELENSSPTPQQRQTINPNPNRSPSTPLRTPIPFALSASPFSTTTNQLLPREPHYITATTRALVVPARPTLPRVLLEIFYRLPNILIPAQSSLQSSLNLRSNARTTEQLSNSCTPLATFIAHQRTTSLLFLFSQMLMEAKYTIFTAQSDEKQVPSIVLHLTPTDNKLPLNTSYEISHLRQLNTGDILLVHTSTRTEASLTCEINDTTYRLVGGVLDHGSKCYSSFWIVPGNEKEGYYWYYRGSQNESLLIPAADGVGVTWLWATYVMREELVSRVVEGFYIYEKVAEFPLTPFAKRTNTELLERLERKEKEKKAKEEERAEQEKQIKESSKVTGWLKRGPVRGFRK